MTKHNETRRGEAGCKPNPHTKTRYEARHDEAKLPPPPLNQDGEVQQGMARSIRTRPVVNTTRHTETRRDTKGYNEVNPSLAKVTSTMPGGVLPGQAGLDPKPARQHMTRSGRPWPRWARRATTRHDEVCPILAHTRIWPWISTARHHEAPRSTTRSGRPRPRARPAKPQGQHEGRPDENEEAGQCHNAIGPLAIQV